MKETAEEEEAGVKTEGGEEHSFAKFSFVSYLNSLSPFSLLPLNQTD